MNSNLDNLLVYIVSKGSKIKIYIKKMALTF
uniref:Uncharacterized protein n=1 Tax=Rhizophora mucronata TaxID=61149 RepID=A0A2P2Q9Z6_RHIMU